MLQKTNGEMKNYIKGNLITGRSGKKNLLIEVKNF